MQELTSIEVLLSKNNKTRMESLKNIYRTTVAIALLTAATIVSAQEGLMKQTAFLTMYGLELPVV